MENNPRARILLVAPSHLHQTLARLIRSESNLRPLFLNRYHNSRHRPLNLMHQPSEKVTTRNPVLGRTLHRLPLLVDTHLTPSLAIVPISRIKA